MKELGKVYFGTNTKMYKNIAHNFTCNRISNTYTNIINQEKLIIYVCSILMYGQYNKKKQSTNDCFPL